MLIEPELQRIDGVDGVRVEGSRVSEHALARLTAFSAFGQNLER
jgi:hypothetical protein